MDNERRQFNEDQDRQWARSEQMESNAELAEYQQSEYDFQQSLEREATQKAAEVDARKQGAEDAQDNNEAGSKPAKEEN